MKELSVEELKEIQLEITDYVAKFCDDNNIKYWLDFGTLIGAVRHGGYIPWDDDIDLGMLREDYERFAKEFNISSNGRYVFDSTLNNKDFYLPYGKVFDKTTILFEPDEKGVKQCVNVDIFVYDKMPDDVKESLKIFKKRDLYRKLDIYRKTNTFTKEDDVRFRIIKNAFVKILKILPYNYFVNKIANLHKSYMNLESTMIAPYGSYEYVTYNDENVKECIKCVFEGREYKIPKAYHEYLTVTYGNYMELPKEEDRVSHHKFIAYKNQ